MKVKCPIMIALLYSHNVLDFLFLKSVRPLQALINARNVMLNGYFWKEVLRCLCEINDSYFYLFP